MSQDLTALDPRIASLPPHTLEELQAAKTEIDAWYTSGGIVSAAPVDALTKVVREILAAGNRSPDDLADPATRRAMSLGNKQEYLAAFREVFLILREREGLDVAELTAEAERLRSVARRDGPEERDKVENWTKLAAMLQEKEEMERRLGEQVVELEDEEGLR